MKVEYKKLSEKCHPKITNHLCYDRFENNRAYFQQSSFQEIISGTSKMGILVYEMQSRTMN